MNSINCKVLDFSKNHINLEMFDNDVGSWRIMAFYGMPERTNRRRSWDLMRTIAATSSIPWVLIGDINDLASPNDKSGGAEIHQWLMDGFRETLSDCYLLDLPLEGYPYTWQRKEGDIVTIEERLDRALVSPSWFHLFPHARLNNLFFCIRPFSYVVVF